MKRIVALLLSFVLTIPLFVGCEKRPQKTPISDFEYTKTSDGTGIIISRYIGTNDVVVIPDEIDGYPVTVIGMDSFSVNNDITEVYFGKNIDKIGNRAFAFCKNLKYVHFGKNTQSIYDEAFCGCESLQEIILPKKLKFLGDNAFSQCLSAKKIFIPKTLEEWGETPFVENTSVTDIVLENGLKKIDSYSCFTGCLVETITIPASVEEIAPIAFNSFPNLKEVYFKGDAPKKIGSLALGRPEQVTVYYNPSRSGWDTTSIRDEYNVQTKR